MTEIVGLTADEVVERYANVVSYWAGRTYGLTRADRVQAGFLGLLKAIPRFDPARGVKFATYAGYWIRCAIVEEVQWNGSLIRIPSHNHKRGERPPKVASLSTPCGADDSGDLYGLLLAPEPQESIADLHDAHRLLAQVGDPRDRHCLWECVAMGMQLNRVGARLGISAERVRQLIKRAIGEIRDSERRREAARRFSTRSAAG